MASLAILACPLLIPAEHVVTRALSLLLLVDLFLN